MIVTCSTSVIKMKLLITSSITITLITQVISAIPRLQNKGSPKEEEGKKWDCVARFPRPLSFSGGNGQVFQGHYPSPEEMDKCCVDEYFSNYQLTN